MIAGCEQLLSAGINDKKRKQKLDVQPALCIIVEDSHPKCPQDILPQY